MVKTLLNAADIAAESGREIEVRVSGSLEREAGLVEVLVEDDGPGIPGEVRDRVENYLKEAR